MLEDRIRQQKKSDTKWSPLLRKQKGFLDRLTTLSDSGEIIYIYTFWKDSEGAEKYDCRTLPPLTTLLTGVIDGAPHVHAFGSLRGRLSHG